MQYNFKFGDKYLLAPKINYGGIYSVLVAGYYSQFLNSLEDDEVVLDGGANIGAFTLAASSIADQVIAVEPNPENFRYLVHNIRLNKMKNVIPINAALSDFNGVTKFIGEGESGHISFNGINVPSITIDTLESRFNVTFDGIKLDIEGAEPMALLGGGKETLTHAKRLVYELDERQWFIIKNGSNPSYSTLNNYLKGLGYALTQYEPDIEKWRLLKENLFFKKVKIGDIIINEFRNNFWFEYETLKNMFSSRNSNNLPNYNFMMVYGCRI